MTAVAAPYTLIRRDIEAGQSTPPPAERRAGLLRADVERIIAQRHFSLAFQPVVNLLDRRVAAYEALMRLQPSAGNPRLPTRVFVDIAAGWGLGTELDAAVLDAVLHSWRNSNTTPVVINLVARSLQNQEFVEHALSCIGSEGRAVLVDVTSTSTIDDMTAFADGVAALQDIGARVCLDDLGVDETTLNCMRMVRFDQVKLAGHLVTAAAAGDRGRRLVAALVRLAVATGAETAAKLIETLPQAWQMQELGISYGQGWLFGLPGKLVG